MATNNSVLVTGKSLLKTHSLTILNYYFVLHLSGDENGVVVVRRPTKTSDRLQVRSYRTTTSHPILISIWTLLPIWTTPFYQVFDNSFYKEPKLQFSFLRHDFGYCFLPVPPGCVEEEVTLVCTNNSPTPVTVRCLLKKTAALYVEYDQPTVFSEGVTMAVVNEGDSARKEKKAVKLNPGANIKFRIVFTPREVRVTNN